VGEPVTEGKTNLDFLEQEIVSGIGPRHQLGQTDNYASIPPLSFLQAECPTCRPTNGVKVL